MYNPQANPDNVVICGSARFTVLHDRMIRLEWAQDGQFEDRASLAAVHRCTEQVAFKLQQDDAGCVIDTGAVRLSYRADGKKLSKRNVEVVFDCAEAEVTWHPGLKDKGNLGGTLRTLDGCNANRKEKWNQQTHQIDGWRTVPMQPGLLSRDGWTVVDDSAAAVLDEEISDRPWPCARPEGKRQDLYLLAYGHDYKAALADAAEIFGRQPLIPRYALGYWYSRYWAYTDKEIESLVKQFDQYDVPIDVMVIDMDWHKIGWTGTSWCRDYFPDPAATLQWLQQRGVKTSLNLHPADGVGQHEDAFDQVNKLLGPAKVQYLKDKHGLSESFKRDYLHLYTEDESEFDYVPFDITDPDYMDAYFKALHRPLEAEGVDVWWMDWQQGESSAIPGLDTLPWINQLHWDDQVRNPDKSHLRPICFSRYGGIGAGRYPIGFSGDTHITWESLAYQPGFTAMASNVMYGTWSHDIGGHMSGNNTPELYTRWMQFGIYSPILRTHANKSPESDRRVFAYPEPYSDLMMGYIRQRYDMVPYIYAAMRQAHEQGISLLRPMYYDYPEEDQAYQAKQQYGFGDDLLVAPVCQAISDKDQQAGVKVWLPAGQWFDVAHGRLLEGDQLYQQRYRLDEIPVFAKAGAVIAGQSGARRLEAGSYPHPTFTIYPGANGSGELYEDDGVSLAYQQGEAARIVLTHRSSKTKQHIDIAPANGDFDGFIDQRPLDLVLPGTVPAKHIMIDGSEIPFTVDLDSCSDAAWCYDGDTATITIRLPKYRARQGLSCTITKNRSVSYEDIDGLAGLQRRLVSLARDVTQESFFRTFFKDERFAIRLGQTGNRISRQPASIADELAMLRHELPTLPDHLTSYAKAYRKHRPMLTDRAQRLTALAKQAKQIVQQFG